MLVEMLDKGVVAFLDGILIYSNTMEDDFKLLKKVFTCLPKHMFYCKVKKCSFLQKTTTLDLISLQKACALMIPR